jgi:hypothetical protein
MIQLPFSRDCFADEAKSRMSGINTTLEFDNIESGLLKAAHLIADTIGEQTYSNIVKAYPDSDVEALEFLQRSLLHWALNEQLIYLIVRIGNDGITTKKNNDETTIYKYQQDELANNLINTAWFWMGKLIDVLNRDPENFKEWADSEQKKDLDELPISVQDFNRWLGINNLYFIIRVRWIIREVWMDNVEPRFGEVIDTRSRDKVARAVVYSVMALACKRLAYGDLPESVRKDIDNEQSKTNKDKAETHIRESVARQFEDQALRYWKDLDLAIQANKKNESVHDNPFPVTGDDKFMVV